MQLLRNNNKAKGWLRLVKQQNPACDYRLELPDQSSHPTKIDLSHILSCGAAPAPRALDASVSYEYDPNAKAWIISRFSS